MGKVEHTHSPIKRNGKLIVIEGIDGSGKSTLAENLNITLSKLGHDCIRFKEPTNGFWGQQIRNMLIHHQEITPEQEFEWFLNDRKEDVSNNIMPSLQNGQIVILDRYYFSSVVYQSLRGMNRDVILKANTAFSPVPDLLIITDLSETIALQRIQNSRAHGFDAFENSEKLKKVRQGFLEFANEPYALLVDALLNPLQICDIIINELRKRNFIV